MLHRVTCKAPAFGLNKRQDRSLNVTNGDINRLPDGVKVSCCKYNSAHYFQGWLKRITCQDFKKIKLESGYCMQGQYLYNSMLSITFLCAIEIVYAVRLEPQVILITYLYI